MSKSGALGSDARRRGRPAKDVPAWALFGLWRLVRQELRGPRDVAAACERLTLRHKNGIHLPAFDAAGKPVKVAPIFDAEMLRKHYKVAEEKRHGTDDSAKELNRQCVEWEARHAIAWRARIEAAARAEAAEASLRASEQQGLFQTLQFYEMSRRANAAAHGVRVEPTVPPVPRKNRR